MRLFHLALLPIWTLPFLTSHLTNAQVYRCLEDGLTVFSQSPCGADAEEVHVRARSAPSGSAGRGLRPGERAMLEHLEAREQRARESAAAQRAAQRESKRLEDAVRLRSVTVGMGTEQVRRAWGTPAEIINGMDSDGSWQRWEYIRGPGGPRQYVRFRNGHVTGASTRPR